MEHVGERVWMQHTYKREFSLAVLLKQALSRCINPSV